MAIALKAATWAGIVLVPIVIFVVLSILIGRRLTSRPNRRIASIGAAAHRRRSRHFQGPPNSANADFARTPGVRRNVLTKSTRAPYERGHGWNAVTSRDSLPRNQTASKTPEIKADSAHTADVPSLSWPLPRRLTRSKVVPLLPVHTSLLAPINERRIQHSKELHSLASNHQNRTKDLPTSVLQSSAQIPGTQQELDQSETDETSITVLKPNPLFHGQQRSFSSEDFGRQRSSRPIKTLNKVLSDKPGPDGEEPWRPRLTRSISLRSQETGLAPMEPIPHLPPFPGKPEKIDRLKNKAEHSPSRSSAASFESGNTFLLDDGNSRIGSHVETDFTSLSSHPVFGGKSNTRNLYDGGSQLWDPSQLRPALTSPASFSETSIRPKATSQKSFTANIEQYTLPRSCGSGLSVSYVDRYGSPRRISNASHLERLSRDLSMDFNKLNSITSKLSQLPRGDLLQKRASTSILQDVSGNRGSPIHKEPRKRPFSVATSDPFQWDPQTSMRQGRSFGKQGDSKRHRRQNCVRISYTAPAISSIRFAPTIEEPEHTFEDSHTSAVPDLPLGSSQQEYTLPRPPSIASFNPQLKSLSIPTYSLSAEASPFSPTPSTVHRYSMERNCNLSISNCSTPTRNPSSYRSTHIHGCDRQSVSSSLPMSGRPLAGPILGTPDHSDKTDLVPTTPDDLNILIKSLPPSTRPPSFLFPFPAPPGRSTRSNPRHHASRGVLGPRAAPPRFRSPSRMSPSRLSPTRRAQRYSPYSPGKDLRETVMSLRRMNSEVVTFDDREREQYLTIGEDNTLVEKEAGTRKSGQGSGTREPERLSTVSNANKSDDIDLAFSRSEIEAIPTKTPSMLDNDGA
ncbi:hypothetical protein MMC06_006879, partial [Schaereria dolodes]|nr:hypothetical protein [Schaereria dolodes]